MFLSQNTERGEGRLPKSVELQMKRSLSLAVFLAAVCERGKCVEL